MSTRSMIAIKQKDGTYLGMWKHWDGNPSYMMPLLNDYGNFCSNELAYELVQFGDCEAVISQQYLDKHPDMFNEDDLTPLSNGFYIECGSGDPVIYESVDDCFGEDIEYLYVWTGRYRWGVIDGSTR